MTAVLALAFAGGAVVGVGADRWLAPTPTIQARVALDPSGILDGLGLTPDQRVQAEAMLAASAPRAEEAMREAAERLRAVADSVDAELRAILTAEQRRRLDDLRPPTFMIRRKVPGGETTVDTLRPR